MGVIKRIWIDLRNTEGELHMSASTYWSASAFGGILNVLDTFLQFMEAEWELCRLEWGKIMVAVAFKDSDLFVLDY